MARAVTAKRSATYDDIIALPEGIVGEIVDDQLYTYRRPDPPHARARTNLGYFVGAPFGLGINGPGGWLILDEPEIQFAKHTLVADLAGWRRERLAELPVKGPLTVAPDWVCEVLSPSTENLDRRRKLAIYGEHGVGHVWLVDPLVRTLEVLRLHEGNWLIVATHGNDEVVRAEPFDAIELPLQKLWSS